MRLGNEYNSSDLFMYTMQNEHLCCCMIVKQNLDFVYDWYTQSHVFWDCQVYIEFY